MPTSKDTQLITIYGRIYLITNSVNGTRTHHRGYKWEVDSVNK